MVVSDDNAWIDEVWRNYRRWKGWAQRERRPTDLLLYRLELERAGVPAPARLLEIGYGDGDFLRFAHAQGFRCTGVEISSDVVDELRRSGIDARVGTIAELPDASHDLIVAFDVFEHMTAGLLLGTLKHAWRVLGPEGRVLARFPNAASPFGAINQYGDITHRLHLSGESFGQLAAVAGFRTLAVRNAAWCWRGNSWKASLVKPLAIVTRRATEVVAGFAWYNRVVPLDPEVVVLLRKDSAAAPEPMQVDADASAGIHADVHAGITAG
jgi:SAM-dependent methyltransferase